MIKAPFGHAIHFDADNDDSVDTGRDFILTSIDSVFVWAYLDTFGDDNEGRIVDNGEFIFLVDGTNDRLRISSDGGGTWADGGTDDVPTGEWVHLGVTRDDSGTVNLFVNGAWSGAPGQASGTPAVGTTNVIIGNRNARDKTFDGAMRDLLVFNQLYTPAEVTEIMQGRMF